LTACRRAHAEIPSSFAAVFDIYAGFNFNTKSSAGAAPRSFMPGNARQMAIYTLLCWDFVRIVPEKGNARLVRPHSLRASASPVITPDSG
jgi:hypothetical protein